MSRAGRACATCRHISEPIDPPAPVTSTTRPCRYIPASGCGLIGARRSRSLMSTWRSRLTLTPPSSSSNRPGNARAGTRARAHASNTDRTTAPGAVGIAMITSAASKRATASSRPASGATTGTPSIRLPSLVG